MTDFTPLEMAKVIRQEEWWDGFEKGLDEQLDPYRQLNIGEFTDQARDELLVIALNQLYQLRVVARTLAVEILPAKSVMPRKRTRAKQLNGHEA